MASLLLTARMGVAAPNPTEQSILGLLPEVTPIVGTAAPAGANASAHAAALRRDPQHTKSYWVRQIEGVPTSKRVVFLVPQYHRNATMPIDWTTLGKEIAEVQVNIDALVRRLALVHGVTCIGTEGDARASILRSSELRQLAWWHGDLLRDRKALLASLGSGAKRAQPPADTIIELLEASIRRTIVYLDGVGAAQARLTGRVTLRRFGLEDSEANQDALALLDQLKKVEEELAKTDPSSQPEAAGVVGDMWLREYPAYEAETLLPLQNALSALDTLRTELRADGLKEDAARIAAFLARVRRLVEALIKPSEVADTIAYYRKLERIIDEGGAEGRKLTRAEKRRRKKLLAQQEKVAARYAEVTMRHREKVAARKVIERMKADDAPACVLVMGAGHEEGLAKELIAAATSDGVGPPGIVVVAPFNFEE
ncbi:MAG: hypothetical protein V3T05_06420 [Myxococcota bacterium]